MGWHGWINNAKRAFHYGRLWDLTEQKRELEAKLDEVNRLIRRENERLGC